ncbi:MAG: hypothetical protein MSS16_02450 [Streptococcus orisratti]|uniref:hypothetical protein n=1 Tax=Streptococcus orisratti TaxID=114652 RepID=UPI0023571109|nr:hypothetical protein [Streptococcus orisratti]MCI7676951.1 hypothetical protein [Streptococcus orisratti]MDY4001548.1 hypothetical protein [Streptococcus orisratti]MDY5636642.1 hypothetical protein [Streptococcus orisratti]
MKYVYSGTLVATVSDSSSTNISAEFLGSGFSYYYTSGATKYYRLPFNQNGTISLY